MVNWTATSVGASNAILSNNSSIGRLTLLENFAIEIIQILKTWRKTYKSEF